jgi:hypothetical protein
MVHLTTIRWPATTTAAREWTTLEVFSKQRKRLEDNMSTVNTGRSTQRRRRLHTALGAAAMTVTAVATIAVGARAIGVAPPPDQIQSFCPVVGQCVQQIPDTPYAGTPFIHHR